LLQNHSLIKIAQEGGPLTELINKVKDYFGQHIDPNDPVSSLLGILTPGLIFSFLGYGWLGGLIGLAINVFHVDVKGIISSIINKIKGLITGNKPTNSEKVDEIVASSVQEFDKPISETSNDTSVMEDTLNKLLKSTSTVQLSKDIRLVKLAIVQPIKTAKWGGGLAARQKTTMTLLAKVLGWIFKVILASAGLLVAGDVVNKFVGRPNAFDGGLKDGKPIAATPVPLVTSKQTKFPKQSNYIEEQFNSGDTNWVESVANNDPSITAMLIQFAKDVYNGLEGYENIIRTSPAFEIIKNRIITYNRTTPGQTMVFIPKYFKSKKKIVDLFIDDVAEKAT
jgi:hypothetical protein